MPACGGTSVMILDPNDKPVTVQSVYGGISDTDPLYKKLAYSDWIVWQRRGQDPVQNQFNTCPGLNITYSALAPYLAIKRLDHTTDLQARNIAPVADSMFRCPTDRVEAHFLNGADNSRGSYLYSYAINRLYSMPVSGSGKRFDGKFNGRISSIRNPGEKVLYICQDEKTADDGTFSPTPATGSTRTRPSTWARRGTRPRSRRPPPVHPTATPSRPKAARTPAATSASPTATRVLQPQRRPATEYSGNSTPTPPGSSPSSSSS